MVIIAFLYQQTNVFETSENFKVISIPPLLPMVKTLMVYYVMANLNKILEMAVVNGYVKID